MLRTEYQQYLRSSKWSALKKEALRQAKGRCQLCNVSENLQAHHRTYERVGNEWISDLTILCIRCHKHLRIANWIPGRKQIPTYLRIKSSTRKDYKRYHVTNVQLKKANIPYVV